MAKFIIKSDDPINYKKQILKFWKDYLPGTSVDRFEWLLDNPAGPAVWFFAIDEDRGSLAGVISVVPKGFFIDDAKVKAGVVGDFMIHDDYRVFGPALKLLKAAVATVEQGLFDFVYTLPNVQSEKLVSHAGFKPLRSLHYMVRPICLNFLLEKYIGRSAANLFDKICMPSLNLFSRDSWFRAGGKFTKVDWSEYSRDLFWENDKRFFGGALVGGKSFDYLKWRYHLNPEGNLHVYAYETGRNNKVQGFCAYSIDKDILEIYDIDFLKCSNANALFKNIRKIAKLEKCKRVYILTNLNNKYISFFRKNLYFDSGKHCDVFVYPESREYYDQWDFFSSSRSS